jgi:hypothetical protein
MDLHTKRNSPKITSRALFGFCGILAFLVTDTSCGSEPTILLKSKDGEKFVIALCPDKYM